MIKKIIQKIVNEKLKLRIKRFNQFKRLKPYNLLDENTINDYKIKLEPYYSKYIQEISRPDMAASLELASFLYAICKLNQFHKLLDTGSGFSSFVLRMYAKETPGVRVFSVDDDEAWLEKTKDFLKQYQLDTQNVYTLKEFLERKESDFDCILHDLNFVEVRINYVEQIISMAKKGGLIILDDVHKPDYLNAVLTKIENMKLKMYILKNATLDRYGRYSLAVFKE